MGVKLIGLCAALAAAFVQSTSHAAPAAQLESARGVVMVQPAQGGAPRIGSSGVPLEAGDRITTAEGALALLKFEDGTRMTLRPNTELVVAEYRYRTGADSGSNSMLLQLMRGGLRTVTGLISKGAPNVARIQTSTATIGIRGTDFDARVCERDCGSESAAQPAGTRPNVAGASARVLSVDGDVRVADSAGHVRRLIAGSPVYPGEVLETSANAGVALAFRDGARMNLGAGTRTRLDDFVFDEANAAEGRLMMSLLKGSMRVMSGRIATANVQGGLVNTRAGTVTLRPGGLDLRCSGECAGEAAGAGLEVFAWAGEGAVASGTPATTQVLQAGQGVVIGRGAARTLASLDLGITRPDALNVPAQLFAVEQVGDDEPGVFVHVRDGHVEIASAGQSLHLGRGETGMARTDGRTARPLLTPRFIEYDRTPVPIPTRTMSMASMVVAEARTSAMCR